MKSFLLVFLGLCFWCFSFGQNPLEELLTDEKFLTGRQYVMSLVPKEVIEAKGTLHTRYFEAGVFCIPKIEAEYKIDTTTLSLAYDEDSILYVKTHHSLKLSNQKTFYPHKEDRNCLSTSWQSFVFRFGELNPALEDEKISIDSMGIDDVEKLVENYNQELYTKKYKIRTQQPFSWMSIENWDDSDKTKVDLGVMDSVYKDEEGNIYIVFDSGYYTKYREVLCCRGHHANLTTKKIQLALKERGYDVSIDNIMGESTKATLLQFQKDENLPQGNLNMETLRALGILY